MKKSFVLVPHPGNRDLQRTNGAKTLGLRIIGINTSGDKMMGPEKLKYSVHDFPFFVLPYQSY